MNASTVWYGSLAVPVRAQRRVDEAFGYLMRDSAARSIIERLESSAVPHQIRIDHRHGDRYEPWDHAIVWDPTSAMRTTQGGRQSPALALAHEMDHATVDDREIDRLLATPVPGYDNAEEYRVITGSERHAAHTLHESARTDHRGSVYRVDDPLGR